MGAGTTWLPGVLKIASDMTAPDAPVIAINETAKTGTTYEAESVTATLPTQTHAATERAGQGECGVLAVLALCV